MKAFILLAPLAAAFYIPGVAPNSYNKEDLVPLNVNHITPSTSRQEMRLTGAFSYDYYSPALHFCAPPGGPTKVPESLGSILFGDRILTSPFELRMGVNETCKRLCDHVEFDPESAKRVNRWIAQNYNVNWIIDGMPAGQIVRDPITDTTFISPGFQLGTALRGDDGTARRYLNNHYDIVVQYHEVVPLTANAKTVYRVVGATVYPSSRANSLNLDDQTAECGDASIPLMLSMSTPTPVTWTYSVHWVPSSTAWATRWDNLLHVYDPRIQWFSLILVTALVIFLSATAAGVLMRALKKDIARYNKLDAFELGDYNGTSAGLEDGVQDDSGWKLVHGDVFRAPRYPLLLSVLLGSGAQLFFMTAVTILFALFGFLSPSYRGMLATVMLIIYTFFGGVGGYVSSRVYKTFNGESWKRNTLLTPLLVPGLIYGFFFLLNLLLWANHASGAVPFSTMLAIVAIWFVISVPLSFAGSYIGFRANAIEPPVRTNQIPRQIPESSKYLSPVVSTLFAGVPTFLAIFTELHFIMNSIWLSKFFYMFGFLFLTYALYSLMTAAVTILSTYFLLCSENYRWQWRAFFAAGASALFVFVYALYYAVSSLSLSTWSGLGLYLGYSFMLAGLCWIMTGTVGFFAAWAFVHKIYGSIKVD